MKTLANVSAHRSETESTVQRSKRTSVCHSIRKGSSLPAHGHCSLVQERHRVRGLRPPINCFNIHEGHCYGLFLRIRLCLRSASVRASIVNSAIDRQGRERCFFCRKHSMYIYFTPTDTLTLSSVPPFWAVLASLPCVRRELHMCRCDARSSTIMTRFYLISTNRARVA